MAGNTGGPWGGGGNNGSGGGDDDNRPNGGRKPNNDGPNIPEIDDLVNKGREHLVEEGLSKVEIGGQVHTLKALCEEHPDELLGADHFANYGANTQFLLKFLDSAIRLHIQCHPTILE